MSQTPLEADAIQAWEQHQAEEAAEEEAAEEAQVDAARTHLAGLLGVDGVPRDVSGLTVAAATQGQDWKLTVLTDGRWHLAVHERDGGFDVRLVTPEEGWQIGPVVTSLWQLGQLLEARGAAEVPAWQPDTAYAAGDRVRFDGIVYECIKAHISKLGSDPSNKADLWVRI